MLEPKEQILALLLAYPHFLESRIHGVGFVGQSYQFLHPAADVLRVGRPPDALQELR